MSESQFGVFWHAVVPAITLEDLSVTVVYLREGTKIGTGFFVYGGHFYLVTAEHVANHLTPKSTATVRAPGDVPDTFTLEDFAPGMNVLPWEKHNEGDVAVLPLRVSEKLAQRLESRFLPATMLEANESAPQRERPVTVMGFPLALGTTGHFSPITSEAKPASGLLRISQFDTKTEATFFVLDKPSIGGFSGAPVFLMPSPYSESGALVFQEVKTPPRCVGLVHGTISDNTGGKLAAIVPASVIMETIRTADMKRQ